MKCLCDVDDGNSIGIVYETEDGAHWAFIQLNQPNPNLLTCYYYYEPGPRRIDMKHCWVEGRATTNVDATDRPEIIALARERPLELIMELML